VQRQQCLATHALPVRLKRRDVIPVLEAAITRYGAPEHISNDNGAEFIAYAIPDWLENAAIKTIYITPESPWESGHTESFHDKLRDECLNRKLFGSLLEASMILESWRVEHNDLRPHSSLGYLSPSEYMQKKQSDGGFATPNPAPLAAAVVRGEVGATSPWRQENQTTKQTADLQF
jgi:putative transposase